MWTGSLTLISLVDFDGSWRKPALRMISYADPDLVLIASYYGIGVNCCDNDLGARRLRPVQLLSECLFVFLFEFDCAFEYASQQFLVVISL